MAVAKAPGHLTSRGAVPEPAQSKRGRSRAGPVKEGPLQIRPGQLAMRAFDLHLLLGNFPLTWAQFREGDPLTTMEPRTGWRGLPAGDFVCIIDRIDLGGPASDLGCQ